MRYFGIIIILFSGLLAKAQGELQGFVTDENNIELPYTHIANLTAKSGTISTSNGYFALPAHVGDTIRFSFTGYKSVIIEVLPDMTKRQLEITMVPDQVMLPSIWVYSNRYIKVPKRYIGKAMKINGVREPDPDAKPIKPGSIVFGTKMQDGPFPTIGPSITLMGPFTYFTKSEKEKRKAVEAIKQTNETITFSKFMALNETRGHFKSTFNLDDVELDRIIRAMNREQPFVQYLTNRQSLNSTITAYISDSVYKWGY
ncbi:MAG: carboxypeptidase-like regulatory domain-containing protein [Cyclobacteriaceae bacterium]